MSDDYQPLNDLGLLHMAENYISAQGRESTLWTAMEQAKKAWEEARGHTEALRKKMGAHTKQVGCPLLVQINANSALLIPTPRDGYSDTEVYPQLHSIRGMAQLTKTP